MFTADYPAVTLHDNVALGYQELYNIVSGLGTNQTLDALWDALVESADGDAIRIADFGAIFEMHNVSPSRLEMTVNGVATDTWDPSSGDTPMFQWRVPQGAPDWGVGGLLNHFGVKVFDANTGELVYDTNLQAPTADGPIRVVPGTSGVQWVPSPTQVTLLSRPGRYTWTVYGADYASDSETFSGPYCSGLQQFEVE